MVECSRQINKDTHKALIIANHQKNADAIYLKPRKVSVLNSQYDYSVFRSIDAFSRNCDLRLYRM